MGGAFVEQNTIAIIWDFDKTLIPGYMQDPIFKRYNIDSTAFWDEVNSLPAQYIKQGIHVNKDTIYLNHILTCVKQGLFSGLSNAELREMGKELNYYKGIPEIFEILTNIVSNEARYRNFNIHVEHYVISTGLSEMIRGSSISQYIDGIWGCEFIETPIRSKLNTKTDEKVSSSEISQIGYMIDNTSKTRAIFEINKGANKFQIDVNSKIDKAHRRVPFENMIYIADGPSDVPVFSVVRQYGGRTFAIYPKGNRKAFRQVNNLIRDGRIDMYAEADYSKDTLAYMWLTSNVQEIAERIYNDNIRQIQDSAGSVPTHEVYTQHKE